MQSKSILKIDYILSFYPVNHYYALVYSIIPPLIASYLIVFWLPKITKRYYARALDFEYENKILKEKKDQEFLKVKGGKLEAEKDVIKKQAEIKKEKIKSEKSQEEIWLDDYIQFKKASSFPMFNYIVESIYTHAGRIKIINLNANRVIFQIPQEILVYAHTNGLVSYDKQKSTIELTEKGKFFVKQFSIKS